MTRLASIFAAAALLSAPVVAGTYSAKPVTQPADARIIARDIAWACTATACKGTTDESRPAVICQGLAKRTGQLQSFAVDGRAFSAAELARCNSVAKGAASVAAASN